MGLAINTNIEALNAYRNLSHTQSSLSKSLERLSSGLRINRAADDSSGLSISENLRSQINGFKRASANAQDAISLIQTTEGALGETTSLLQRVRDLAVQAANTGANDTPARAAIQNEVVQSLAEIDRIASATVFGSKNLLDGSNTANGFTFHVGYSSSAYNQMNVKVSNMGASALGLTSANISALIAVGSSTVLNSIDFALTTVTATRSTLGAYQNRLESTIANLGTAVENLSASESRIRDTDMAEEMTNYSKQQILQQAGTAMLSQANSLPNSVLRLLQQ